MQMVDQERLVEHAKVKCVEHTDFNLFDAFKLFDVMAKGSLTYAELSTGLTTSLGLIPTLEELELFFNRYDKDKDGRLRFSEFCDAFVPQDKNYAQLLNQRQGNRRQEMYAGVRAD